MTAVATTPNGDIDLWAPVARDALPNVLVDAMEKRDWATVRAQLGSLMDGITTDGVYGRALLQLTLELPVGIDPVFDSYRAAASIDHGDWDGLRRCLAGSPIEPIQLLGMRDVLLAPLNQVTPKDPAPYAMLFAPYEYQLSQMAGAYRRWARAMLSFQALELVWARPDVPAGRPHPPTPTARCGEHGLRGGPGWAIANRDGIRPRGTTPRRPERAAPPLCG